MEMCPCNSFRSYSNCCEPLLCREKEALTAEALMRSRYTAYVKKNVDYLICTYASKARRKIKRVSIEQGMKSVQWVKLEIVSILDGRQNHQTGEVEFVAHYQKANQTFVLKERSFFVREI